jgi:hypothetical protein
VGNSVAFLKKSLPSNYPPALQTNHLHASTHVTATYFPTLQLWVSISHRIGLPRCNLTSNQLRIHIWIIQGFQWTVLCRSLVYSKGTFPLSTCTCSFERSPCFPLAWHSQAEGTTRVLQCRSCKSESEIWSIWSQKQIWITGLKHPKSNAVHQTFKADLVQLLNGKVS